jgi:hypothetical protein
MGGTREPQGLKNEKWGEKGGDPASGDVRTIGRHLPGADPPPATEQ